MEEGQRGVQSFQEKGSELGQVTGKHYAQESQGRLFHKCP